MGINTTHMKRRSEMPADLAAVARSLRASIWNLVKSQDEAYIGATNSVQERWDEEHSDDWDVMAVVLVKITRFEEVVWLERQLISMARARNAEGAEFLNERDGGEGLKPGTGPWAIYVCWR